MTQKQTNKIISLHSKVVTQYQADPSEENAHVLEQSLQLMGWAMDFMNGRPTPSTESVQELINLVEGELNANKNQNE